MKPEEGTFIPLVINSTLELKIVYKIPNCHKQTSH